MNVFTLRQRLVDEYADYTRSFITVRDRRIRNLVSHELDRGLLWPEPMVQLNPAFEPGAWIDELVDEGVLHPECRRIFRKKSETHDAGEPLRLHRHQSDAIRVARTGESYVLTTGTGSGKSLAYLIPIVDRVLREGPGRGIRAVVVYPMNALANSQGGELAKFLNYGYPNNRGPVTFRRYTGQERDDERQEIIAHPPDILLTNYVMLELILTRPFDRQLVQAAQGLRFLVLDELHTYRGRQGSDVALLVRRVREACEAHHLQCVGTSATLAGAQSLPAQQAEIAPVASRLFGTQVRPESVIVETLRRATRQTDLGDPSFRSELTERVRGGHRPPASHEAFLEDPVARWVEGTLGLAPEPGSNRLTRARPMTVRGLDGAAVSLSQLIGLPEGPCAEAIQDTLLAGYFLKHPETGSPVFAFRLHQFFSRGDTVYASLEPESRRHVTTQGQQFMPGDRSRILLPLAFCRQCGQEYYTVRARRQGTDQVFEPRELLDTFIAEGTEAGFLNASWDQPWPEDFEAFVDRLPDEWLEWHGDTPTLKPDRRKDLPKRFQVSTLGRAVSEGGLRPRAQAWASTGRSHAPPGSTP